jgi:glycosyltransferase involved in cell wall biosynthesis
MTSNGSIRVLKVLPTLHCGGTENQVTALSRALADEGFDLEVACLHRAGPLVNAITERAVPLHEYPISSFWNPRSIGQQLRLARHIVGRRLHIVHTYSFYGNVFAVPPAAAVGVPVIIASVRDRGVYLTPLQTRAQKYVCHLADRILVNADAVKEWLLEQGYPLKKIVVIRNGVDVTRFDALPDSDRLRQQLGLAPGERMVTVVSRVTRLKGLEQFIDAASLLASWFPRVRFVIAGDASAGDGDYVASLKQRARQMGVGSRVLFTGHRFDVPAVLGSAAVSVMPSLNEALPNVLLESMAAGAPIVATRVGGTTEAIAHGHTGLLVPAGDPRALSEAIARLLMEPALAGALGRAARQVAESSFSLSRMVAATEQLYRDLLAQKRTPLRHSALASLHTRR